MVIVLAITAITIIVVAGIIWHARRSVDSGVSAMWWAVRDIHEWHRR